MAPAKKKAVPKKAPAKPRKKMGRPRFVLDFAQLDKLLAMQCGLESVSYFFGCSVDTIERNIKREHKITFAEYADQKKEVGRQMLRQKQFEVAMKGNVALLIFLGKNWLGQSDNPEALAAKKAGDNPQDSAAKIKAAIAEIEQAIEAPNAEQPT